jgi:hypothetical protein
VVIWPMVVLSAEDAVDQLWPTSRGASRSLAIGGLVAFDASLIEIVAVAAGFWHWSEDGYLRVPLVGILGWGCFAVAATWLPDRCWGLPRFVWTPLLATAATHLSLLGLWWGALRWVLRGPLGRWALAGFAAVAATLTAAVLVARTRGRGISWRTWLPRLLAACLFFALLPGIDDVWVWSHVGLSSIPYLCALRWPRRSYGGA